MKSNAIDPDTRSTSDGVSPTTVFKALSHLRRQHMLQYLVQKPGAVALGDVAEYIAIEEGEPTRDRYERLLTGLCHTHVPHLTDAGLVRYDADRETVSLQVEADSLAPYLELALSAPSE
ncbi:DUF7344 domain-containing protein [Natronococcus wangiae]|uniref:DUF7344 domain-containing protein n=1 Tax=Natronococcus wangiae TaxID=3068275 RepID=UPI00273EE5DC|nr:hypothetical protein [Natronococcus sp. AD5]